MSVATYAELRSAVESAVARSDVPAYVYTLATAELNGRLRLRQMESTASLSATGGTETVALPADFLEVRHLFIDADPRVPLDASDGFSQSLTYRVSGQPGEYVVVGDNLHLNPTPDGDYTLGLRYVAKLAAFSADADTNSVLTAFPALYLYAALKHAGIWSQDVEMAAVYGAALENEADRIMKRDKAARYGGGPLRVRTPHTP